MKNKIMITLTLLLAISAWNCEKTIQLDLEQTEPKVVIEGLITDVETNHYIRLSKSSPFYAEGPAPKITGAQVQVTTDEGTIYEYEEIEPGYYQSVEAFTGKVGVTYDLQVEAEEQLFTASESLFRVANIDSLTYEVNTEEQADPEDPGRFYEVLLFVKEPQDTEDYYLFKFFRNDTLLNDDGQTVYFSNDVAIGESINGLPAPDFYAMNDLARIEIYSLTSQAFRFYQDMSANLTSDGGMFSAPPANIKTNLSGGALGYFQVSALSAAEIRLEK